MGETMKRRIIGILGLALSASLIASACGSDSSSSSDTAVSTDTFASTDTLAIPGTDSGTPTTGGTIHILSQLEQVTHLDPQRNYTGSDLAFAGSTMQRTLVSYAFAPGSDGSQLVADLATDIGTPTEGGKVWTFTLRDGATYEDGSAVTCADIAYGTSRVFATDIIVDGPTYAISYLDIPQDADGNSNYPGPYTATADQQALFDKAVACSEDGKTITFTLSRIVADFNYTVTLLAFSPVPKAKDTGEKYDMAPVSSGPYKIESYEPGKSLVLVRNENWSKASDPIRNAYADSFVYEFALDPAVIDERLIADAGDDQYAVGDGGLQPENLQTVFTDDRFKDRRQDDYDPYVSFTAFNVKTVSCVEVRRAVYLGLDREALRTAGGGPYTGDFADGFVKPALADDYAPSKLPEGLNTDGTPNVEAAKASLEEAKTKCPDVYAKATVEGLKFFHPDTPIWQKLVSIWIESLKAAGIVIKPTAVEPSKYYPTVQNEETDYDISRGAWGPDWPNASTMIPELFLTTGGFNLTRNGDDPAYKQFETDTKAALNELDRKAQGKKWQALNQFLVDQLWSIPGTFTKAQDLWGSKVGNAYRWSSSGSFLFGELFVKQ